MNKKQWLPAFYAVTVTSLYRADIYGEDEAPKITKIGLRNGKDSKIAEGRVLSNGTMLAVCRRLVLFVPEGGGQGTFQRELAEVNSNYWGANTSEIVGLFLDENTARLCHKDNNLVYCDPRYLPKTIETLQAIGLDHPKCSISTGQSDSFIKPLMPLARWHC